MVGGDPPVIGGGLPMVGGDPPVIGGDPPVIGGDPPVIGGDPPMVDGASSVTDGALSPLVHSRAPLLPVALLLILSVLFRLPALLNTGAVDSDSAIVGLKAMHILHGELSPFLLGSGYQTSVDSFVAAGFFALLGPTPLALMLSTFVGHLALLGFAFATLRRHVRPWLAAALVLPLVFTPSPLHTYILGPPRQAALTLVFASIWLTDDAARRPAPLVRYAIGSALACLACYADPYALLFLPALGLHALLASHDGRSATFVRDPVARRRVASCLAGAVAGVLPLLWLWRRPESVHGELGFLRTILDHNWALLTDECLPWILSTTAYYSKGHGLAYGPWEAPRIVRALQLAGAAVFVAGILFAFVALRMKRIPWEVRRLGVVGAIMLPITIGGFLVSVMVMDLFSSRYLAALVLMSPFALAPLAGRLGWKRLLLILAPYLTSAGVCGWVGYGDEVRGAHVVELPAEGAGDERALLGMLEDRGIHAAIADYWVSYRLTFLSREAVVVVPIHEREDRYPAYRTTYAGATRAAYIFDPKRSREQLSVMEAEAFSGPSPSRWGSPVERLHSGSLTAVVFDKPAL